MALSLTDLDFMNRPAWRFEAAAGLISGVNTIRKYGANPDVGTSEEDVWNVGGEETLLTTGATMYASATGAATQQMIVFGLDENFDEQTGYVTLNGTAQAEIRSAEDTAQLWTRIHRSYQVSAAPDPAADVYIAESDTLSSGVPDTATKIHALIDFTNAPQQTEKALYTIPRNWWGFLINMEAFLKAGTGSARSAEVMVEIAEPTSLNTAIWTPRRRIMEMNIGTTGPLYSQEAGDAIDMLKPMTNINLRAIATASVNIAGHFELVLVRDG